MDAGVRTERQADAGKSLAAVILGNDAIAAIRPSAPSQLARACVAAGFDIIVPPSWGDELVAGAYLEQLADRLEYAVAPCACALVRSLLERSSAGSAVGCALAAAPPVAAARYVRAKYGESVLITYVGDCPSASDPAIDARFSSAGFLASLNRQGISIEDQPTESVAAETDRWRRYRSTPGGVPALRYLARPPINRVLREGDAESLAHGLPEARSNMVVDFSIAANCVCSGAGADVDDYELPRGQTPIVVAPNGLDLSPAPSTPRVRPSLRARPDSGTEPRADISETPAPVAEINLPKVGPATVDAASTVSAAAPPFEAQIHSMPRVIQPEQRPARTRANLREVKPPQSRRRRVVLLALLPAVVLAAAAALGVAVYRVSSQSAPDSNATRVRPTLTADSLTANTPDSSMGYVPKADSAQTQRDTAASSKPRRPRAIQVVPGWLPQGRPRFTPADTTVPRKP